MPGFGGFNEKKKKKQKQNQKSTNTNPSGFGAPVFVAPKVIPKQKKQE